MAQLIPSQVNYKPIGSFAPRYRYTKVPLFNVSTGGVVISSTASQTLQFKLPAEIYNLNRSILSYHLSVAAGGAGTFNRIIQDAPELASQIQITDGSGINVNTVNYASKYARLQRKLHTKLQDYLTNDPTMALNPSNATVDATLSCYNVADGRGAFPVGTNANVNYFEAQSAVVGTVDAALAINRQYPLGVYKETMFAQDVDSFFGRDMYINIITNGSAQMGFKSVSATDPTATPTALAVDATLTNVYLYLAVEQNPEIRASIHKKYSEGRWSMPIYTLQQTRLPSAGAGGDANITFILQPSNGLFVRKVIYQVYNATEQSNTVMDCSNHNGEKLLTYQTSLNSNPLQDQVMSCALGSATLVNSDDWRHNQQFCKGSVILNQNCYQHDWYHIDSCGEPCTDPCTPPENIMGGLALNEAKTWGLQGITGAGAGNLQHYVHVVVQRMLSVHPQNGIMFDVPSQ